MYTYHHVIRRLTEADKIRLLTDLDSLSSPEAQELGIPQVNCAALREGLCGDTAELPSPAVLARSWDTELMNEAAEEAARRLLAKGVNHVILPPAGSAIVSDGERLSEDPLLSGALSGDLLAGVNRAGLTATAAGYGFTAYLMEDGTVRIQGNNSYGQAGNGTTGGTVRMAEAGI